MASHAVVAQWGNSEAIRIPKGIREELGLHAGDTVSLEVSDGSLVVTPLASGRRVGRFDVPDIGALFLEYDGSYQPQEDAFAAPVGREEL
ncbi:AbrB/MazE/SpoVT family DNA-binding domain-containing protein [Bifidobacterium cuniculi]|uniref:PemI-like protein n=1 Tax=Bifidobacterium cuniculi TaxID=1688 RepID=A0A087AWP0_9BIFI|nr:AbrB/MazE/SpoVT family DNA-binding domain-containing protein [Bifidobacterium cuniculi]KFI63190.1 PemI-like protein [Bifidobacterium cuniculi]